MMKGVTFDAETRTIDVMVVCADALEQRHLKRLYPYAYVVTERGNTLIGIRCATIWVSPRIDQLSEWYQGSVLTRIVAGGIISTMDASEY